MIDRQGARVQRSGDTIFLFCAEIAYCWQSKFVIHDENQKTNKPIETTIILSNF